MVVLQIALRTYLCRRSVLSPLPGEPALFVHSDRNQITNGGDDTIADADLDRLLEKVHRIEMFGESMRRFDEEPTRAHNQVPIEEASPEIPSPRRRTSKGPSVFGGASKNRTYDLSIIRTFRLIYRGPRESGLV